MALIVEDGTGLANAQSYCDVAFIDAYHSTRGNASWAAALTDAKEKAAVNATTYVEQRYSQRFVGARKTKAQALSWPRTQARDRNGFVIAEDEVPLAVKNAEAEYALRALTSPLMPDPSDQFSIGAVKRKLEKVGPLTEETEYVEGSTDQTPLLPAYPAADAWLVPVLKPSGGRAYR